MLFTRIGTKIPYAWIYVAFSPRMELIKRRPKRLGMPLSLERLGHGLCSTTCPSSARWATGTVPKKGQWPVSRTSRKAIRKITTRIFCKAGHFMCCSSLEMISLWSPEMRPKSFGTLEKRAPDSSPVSTLLFRWWKVNYLLSPLPIFQL